MENTLVLGYTAILNDFVDISRLLEEHMLKVVDITDINGMTYFCSRNYSNPPQITAPFREDPA
jgi:hypothetical protein